SDAKAVMSATRTPCCLPSLQGRSPRRSKESAASKAKTLIDATNCSRASALTAPNRSRLGRGGLALRDLDLRPPEQDERRDRARQGKGDQRPERPLEARRKSLTERVAALEERLRMRVEDRGGERDSDRSADLLVRVDQARGKPRLLRRHTCERRDRHGDERKGETEREGDVRGQEVGPVVAVHRDLRRPAE